MVIRILVNQLRKHQYGIPGYALIYVLILFFFLTGCQLTSSPFAQTTSNAGSEFAAASTTLVYFHEGKLTQAYTLSSFQGYQDKLGGIDQQLPLQQGAPDTHVTHSLLEIYKVAMRVVNQPCLEASGCDWHMQIKILDKASEAFLKAGGQ